MSLGDKRDNGKQSRSSAVALDGICTTPRATAHRDPRTDPRRVRNLVRRRTKVQGDGIPCWSFANEHKPRSANKAKDLSGKYV